MKTLNRSHILDFSGGYLDVGKHADFDLTTEMTVGAWIRPESGTGLQATILSKHYTAYEPQVQNNKLVFERGREYASRSNIPQKTWSYVAVSFDASLSKDNLKLYINGRLDKTFNVRDPLTVTQQPLWIGGRPGGSLLFSGQMAGVTLWNRAHNPWQIKQDYNDCDPHAPDVVGCWKMQEGEGQQVQDESKHGHHANIVGTVSWQPVTEAITYPDTQVRQRVRNTTVERLDQLLDDANDNKEDHQVLPASGRNGEATQFLNRVRLHKAKTVALAKQQHNQQIQTAKAAKADKLQQAHIEAAKKMNSARFDSLWFVYRGRIHQVNQDGTLSEFYVGNTDKVDKKVPANQVWFDTGVELAAGETVKIKYTGGRWTISPTDRNLTAKGTTRFNGRPGYALPGKPAGSLIGKVGNGKPFYVGKSYELPVGQTGKLYLTTNDDQGGRFGAGYRDNSGSINVNITHVKQAVSVEASDLMVDQARELIFWSQATVPFTLHSAKLDGSGYTTLVSHPDKPITSVALDEVNQYVYHIVGAGEIMRVKYDGSKHESLLDISGPAKDHYWQLEIDPIGKKMYWTNDYSIWRANLKGKSAELVVSNHEAPFPIDLAVDGESKKLYWVDKELEVVRRSNLDGSEPEDLHAAPKPVRGLMLDYVTEDMRDQLKQEVYWASREQSITAQTPGIVGLWELDEGQGEQLNNHTAPFDRYHRGLAKIDNDLPANLNAPFYALQFDGSDYAKMPNHYIDPLKGHSFTIAMWIKPDTVPAQGDAGLMSNANLAANKNPILLLRNAKPYFAFYNNDLAGNTKIKAGEWVHLAFRYDLQKQEQAIFINGKLDGSSGNHAPLDNDPGALTLLGVYNKKFFKGLMADIRIAAQALTEQSIQAFMQAHHPSELMADITSGPAWDRSDTPPTVVAKQSVLTFNGSSTYLKLLNADRLGFYRSSFTVECWLKPDIQRDGDLTVLGTDTRAANQGLHLTLRKQKPYMGFFGNDLAGKTEITAGEWHHVVWRFNAATMEQAVFVDGRKDASRIAPDDFEGKGLVYVGRWTGGRIFSGQLSELRIWQVARSDNDIATNYRHYRESFAMRGPVDGSDQPEHLFEIPAEGGLNLVSEQQKTFEQRLLAYRQRKLNQEKADADIQQAHIEKDQKVSVKQQELEHTQQTTAASISAKKTEHEQQRSVNRTRLLQAQNDKTQKINNAKQSAKQTRDTADTQAADIKNQANRQADSMKNSARSERDRARSARDKNRR